MPDLQVTVANPKFAVGNPCRYIGVHLRVHVWVDPNHGPHRFALPLRCISDVLEVELRVHIDQHAMLDCQIQLPWQLAIAVEHRPAGARHWSWRQTTTTLAAGGCKRTQAPTPVLQPEPQLPEHLCNLASQESTLQWLTDVQQRSVKAKREGYPTWWCQSLRRQRTSAHCRTQAQRRCPSAAGAS